MINFQRLLNRSLPNYSLIAPQLLLNWSPFYWNCAVELLPCLRCWKLEPCFKDSFPCSSSLFSEWTLKNISHWRYIRLTLHPQPTKRSTYSAESRETYFPTCHITKEKRSKLPLSCGSNFHRWPARSSIWKPSPSVSINSKKN